MRKPYIQMYHIILEVISYILFVAAMIFAAVFAITTEGQIPIHYNLQGEITGYGSPAIVLILPVSMFFTGIIISLVMHLLPTSMMNIPFQIKAGREIKIYADEITMVVLVELVIAVYTLVDTIFIASGNDSLIPTWSMVVVMAMVIVGCFIKMKADNK